jgi:hypothetical protein
MVDKLVSTSIFPLSNFPPLLRDHISPMLYESRSLSKENISRKKKTSKIVVFTTLSLEGISIGCYAPIQTSLSSL